MPGLLSLPGPSTGSDDEGTVVLTTIGPIQGKCLPAGSGTVTPFLGILYAQPLMGAFRFQKPLPHLPWSHVPEATGSGHACPQPPLTLTPTCGRPKRRSPRTVSSSACGCPTPGPQSRSLSSSGSTAGGFFLGAASVVLQDGRFLAAMENVIVASMNYWLGALGFLYLPPAAPGNAGLWDQRLALHWLRDNTAAFGGGPGPCHPFWPQHQGRICRLPSPGTGLQSGAPTLPAVWFSPEAAKEVGRVVAHEAGCSGMDDTALVGCLRGKEPADSGPHPVSLLTLDGDFLPDVPPGRLEAGPSQPIPLLAGITPNEGSYLLMGALNFTGVNASHIGWEELLEVLKVAMPGVPGEAVQAVAQQYIQKRQGLAWYRHTLACLVGDYHVVCPVAKTAGWMAVTGEPVYVYTFNCRPGGLSSLAWTGVPHGSEVPYLFGTLAAIGGANHTPAAAEVALSRRVMQYWAEFARSGNPTGAGDGGNKWPLYNATEQNFFPVRTKPPQGKGVSPARHCSFVTPLVLEYQRLTAKTHGTAKPSRGKEREEEKDN